MTATNLQQGTVQDFVGAPMLIDETRRLVFAKNRIFAAQQLAKLVYTFPTPGMSPPASYSTAREIACALDAKAGVLATRSFLYDLDSFRVIEPTLSGRADQQFFDRDGLLWFLLTSDGVLKAQQICR